MSWPGTPKERRNAACASAAATSTAPPLLTHLTVYSVDSRVLSAVISGPVVGDSGSAEEVAPGSTVPAAHAGELLLNLAHGTFRLNFADIVAKFTKALGTPVPGSYTATIPSTCSDYVRVSGNVPVVLPAAVRYLQGPW
jgi:hypothetical protein